MTAKHVFGGTSNKYDIACDIGVIQNKIQIETRPVRRFIVNSSKPRNLKWFVAASLLIMLVLIASACSGSQTGQSPTASATVTTSASPTTKTTAASPSPSATPGGGLTADQIKELNNLAAIQLPGLDQQRRGCPACHTVTDKTTGAYSLAYEAAERVKAQGRTHPTTAPDGTSIKPTDDVNVTVCLQCHKPGTGDRQNKGAIAPLMLRDIVHPAHMGSQTFKLHYGGQCITCHNIDGQGNWTILTQKVDVNDKGVPNPSAIPIPGAIPAP